MGEFKKVAATYARFTSELKCQGDFDSDPASTIEADFYFNSISTNSIVSALPFLSARVKPFSDCEVSRLHEMGSYTHSLSRLTATSAPSPPPQSSPPRHSSARG
jgi:hypothetical protein